MREYCECKIKKKQVTERSLNSSEFQSFSWTNKLEILKHKSNLENNFAGSKKYTKKYKHKRNY